MADKEPSYARLVRDVVQASAQSLTVDEILEQVNAQRPITTKNPQNTIRTAIQDSAMIVHVGAGYFGWKTRAINGAFLRYTLRESDLLMEVLQYTDEPLVSSDFIGTHYSSVVDLSLTMAMGDNMVKVVTWYDNEWGYATRIADLTAYVAEQLGE